MIYAGILAGGSGVRMGAKIPKQFIHVGEKPIIVHTVEKFIGIADKIIIACPQAHIEYMNDILKKYVGNKKAVVVTGGAHRMDSMLSILAYIFLNCKTSEDDIILTHDGVRPFVTKEIIEENIKTAKKYGICGTFVGATDTVAVSTDSKTLSKVLVRDNVYLAQTPQSFNLYKLKKLFATAGNDIYNFTDLCGLATAFKMKVHIACGAKENIKITTKEDLDFARVFLGAEDENENR